MSDTYEATFTWPAGPNEVIITGTFDNWTKSIKLVRSWEGSFTTTLKFPWESRILYKYIVDGQWVTSRHEKTETDPNGNVNNVFQVPPKYEPTSTTLTRTDVETKTAPAPTPSEPKPQPVPDSVKDSALATEGVHPPNATSYVPSAVGAAVATVTGIDPINVPKIDADKPQAGPTNRTELDLSPAAPAANSAAADGKKAASTQPVEGLPSLLPATSEREVVSPSTSTAAPAAAIPGPKPTVSAPPVTTEVAPHPETTPASKVPDPAKTVEENPRATRASEASSTLQEKVVYGADELGRYANSTPGSTTRSKKKRGSIFEKIKAAFHHEKEKEKPKK